MSQADLRVFLQQNDVAILGLKLSVICQTANLATEQEMYWFSHQYLIQCNHLWAKYNIKMTGKIKNIGMV